MRILIYRIQNYLKDLQDQQLINTRHSSNSKPLLGLEMVILFNYLGLVWMLATIMRTEEELQKAKNGREYRKMQALTGMIRQALKPQQIHSESEEVNQAKWEEAWKA